MVNNPKLKPKYRQVHDLICQGYTRREASETLNIPLGNLDSLYNDALKHNRIKKYIPKINKGTPRIPRPNIVKVK